MAGLSIGDITLGVSHKGMHQWREDIKAELLSTSQQKIRDAGNVEKEIAAGWQGVSEEKFMKDFKKAREMICDDLEKEYNVLKKRLEEVEDSYFDIDKKLMGGE